MAREHEMGYHGQQLVLGEPIAALALSREQCPHQIGGRASAAPLEDPAQVVAEGEHARVGVVHDRRVRAVLEGGDVVDPLSDAVAVVGRDVEHLADDDQRQLEGKVRDDLHLPRGRYPVQQLIGDLLDPLFHRANPPGGERLVREGA